MSEPTTDGLEIEQTYPKTYETLEEVIRAGARKMLIAALEAEAHIQAHLGERDERGYALVVRNRYPEDRTVYYGTGTLKTEGATPARPPSREALCRQDSARPIGAGRRG